VAVVNGIPVSNGSVVEGARVEDIQRDRVRFSYGGERFEVTLGKTNR
jgi:general secretion pathway protein B